MTSARWPTPSPRGARRCRPAQARVIDVDGHPGLESCDPGSDVEDPNLSGRSDEALLLASLWGYLVADAATVLDPDGARCYAQRVIEGLTYEQITDREGAAFQDPDFQASLLEAFEACR